MYLNPGVIVDIVGLTPLGTNSTMFTRCCEVAICDDQPCCPKCKRKVVGYDAESKHERSKIRWRNATRHWKR